MEDKVAVKVADNVRACGAFSIFPTGAIMAVGGFMGNEVVSTVGAAAVLVAYSTALAGYCAQGKFASRIAEQDKVREGR